MAITGINNSSCTSYYASNYKNTVKKTDSEKDSTNTKDGNVTTSTVELKTSRPGVTKTEQIKTGYFPTKLFFPRIACFSSCVQYFAGRFSNQDTSSFRLASTFVCRSLSRNQEISSLASFPKDSSLRYNAYCCIWFPSPPITSTIIMTVSASLLPFRTNT